MDPTATVDSLERQLRKAGDKDRATGTKRYLKSELEHFGVRVPDIRAAAKKLHRSEPDLRSTQVAKLVRGLWKRPILECRLAAVELLWLYRDTLRPGNMPLIEKLLRESRTWALVDPLAVNSAGDLVARYPELGNTLDRWASDDDFWIRRSAMLALLKPLRRGEGDFDRFGRYADSMLEEKEFFIRKAIGWILRETAKKRPQLVYDWVKPRVSRTSGVTIREAVKPLPKNQTDELMAAYRSRN